MNKEQLLYDLMLIANDDDSNMFRSRNKIAQVFEDITDQDMPDNGYMLAEMASVGISSTDIDKLSSMIKSYWELRN